MLTDSEVKAELIKRLRESTQLTDRHCSDDQLIEFTKNTCFHQWTALAIRCEDLKREVGKVVLGIFDNFRGKRYYKREYLRYQRLYNTLLAENACYRRRDAALRGENKALRHERHVKRQNESSGR